MEQNYKMILSYDGTRFYGWEHQPTTDMTIQGKMENVLSLMTGQAVEVIGCGRTDAGVHAQNMVCNARMDTQLEVGEIRDYLNQYLPEDIYMDEEREESAANGMITLLPHLDGCEGFFICRMERDRKED